MSTRTIKDFAQLHGVMVIYKSNAGPVAYGPFVHVSFARLWCEQRKAKPGEDKVKFKIIPYHTPDYWEVT